MRNRITLTDYDGDWALREGYQEPRSKPGFLTREEVVRLYGILGVDGIEITDFYWRECTPAYIRKLAADCGLPIVCHLFEGDLTLPASDRQLSLDRVFLLLDRTAELGAPLAMIIPAFVKEGVSLEEQRGWLIEGLRQCAEHAESLGLILLTENFDDPPAWPLMSRGADCRDICAAVDSPAYRIIYDCGAPLIVGENPLDALKEMAPFVTQVHFKNNRRLTSGEDAERYYRSQSGHRYVGTNLDTGEVDLRLITAELNRIQYGGFVLIEYQGVEDPRTALWHNIGYLRKLMEGVI